MSIDSRSDSSSSDKGRGSRIFKRTSTADVAGFIKKDLSKIGGFTRSIGNSIQSAITNGVNKKEVHDVVYSTGNRELGSDGYEIYNIEEDVEIFISKVSDSAIFEQDQQIVRATDGQFVGPTAKVVKVPKEQVQDGTSGPADMHQLFKNVRLEDRRDQEIHGSVGVVQDGVLVPSSPVNQVPANAEDIFNKMQRTHKVEYEEVSVLNEDGSVETVPVEGCVTESPVSVPDVEPVVGAEVSEEPETVVETIVQEVPEIDGIAVDVEAETPSVTEVPEEPQEESDFCIRTIPESIDVPETIAEAPIEAPAEESIIEEVPVEAPVEVQVEEPVIEAPVEAKPRDEFFIDSESETPVEAPAEEPVIEEVEIWKEDIQLDDVPAEAPIEAPVEEPVVEAPVEAPAEIPAEAPIEAVATLQKMDIGGLEVEGNSGVNAAVAYGDVIAVQESEKAKTSAGAMSAPEHRPLDIEAKKEELASEPEVPEAPKCSVVETVSVPAEAPKRKLDLVDENSMSKIADPVRHRPRYNYSRAMKFTNGKLENISKKDSDEGVQRIAGQTSPRSAPVERLPSAKPRKSRITIDGDVGSIMRLTLPELDLDDDSCTVGYECMYIPDDGMEAVCFAEPPMMEIPAFEFPALSAPVSVPSLVPAAEVLCIGSAPETIAIEAATEAVLIPAAQVVLSIEAPEIEPITEAVPEEPVAEQTHAVVFSFGGSGSEGSVCFSF
ncbi:MAG: hypothetical protein ACI38Y_02855 [Candidatus Methanomethylophilaceae archaeon]